MPNEDLLKKIKKIRLLKEFGQKDIAERLEISIPTYSRFERGVTKTDYTLLKKVCAILEIDFFDVESGDTINTFDENDLLYNKYNSTAKKPTDAAVRNQVKGLVSLLEKQQRANEMLIQKLKSMKLA